MFSLSRSLFCGSFIALATAHALCQGEGLDIADALKRYRGSLSYLRSVSLRVVATVDSTRADRDPELFPQTLDYVFRHDKDTHRAEWVGRRLIYGKDGQVNPRQSVVIKEIADGRMCVSLGNQRLVEEASRSRFAELWYNYDERLQRLYDSPDYGGPLFGRIFGSGHKSVADLLEGSPDLRARRGREKVNGVTCLVLEGTSPYGEVTAWLAPEKGYSAMKWTIEKDPHHLFNGTTLSRKWERLETWQATFEVKKIHGVMVGSSTIFAPVLAVHTLIAGYGGARPADTHEYAISDIQVNPDFEALGAFKIELPEGIRVFNRDAPGIRFYWKDGKPTAMVDRSFLTDLDREIGLLKNDVEAESAGSAVKPNEPTSNEPSAVASVRQTRGAGFGRIWPYILAGALIAAAIGWLVFRWRRV